MTNQRALSRQSGVSLVEVLIASSMMMIVLLGILPLFLRSVTNNQEGMAATEVTNHSRSRVEEMFQLTFDHPNLTLAAGTALTVDESWSPGAIDHAGDSEERWFPGPPSDHPTRPIHWWRTTTVRQFGVNDISDDPADNRRFSTPLASNTDPIFVHFKEIQVTLQSTRESGVLGPSKALTVRVLKPF